MSRHRARVAAVTATVLMAAWMVGCATVTPQVTKDSPPELKQKLVAQRAEARWQALIKGDLDSAYSFLSPGSRAATSSDAYKARIKPGMWRQAKVTAVSCEEVVCKVVLQITYDTARMKGIETPLNEDWIIQDGGAWYVYR